jgi:tripartite-type tricarboxylate transporter receptor subunit TctC
VATSPFVLISHPSFAANNIGELIAMAKARGKSIDFGSPGVASTQHLAMELMNLMAGVQMTHIAYKGGAPALTDLLAGQVPLMFMTTVQSLPYLKDKRVKALGVSTPKRTAVLPDVPTIAESGVPGYESDVWFGIIAPAGVPRPVIDRLHAEIVRILKTPEMQKSLAAQGAEPVGNSPEEFAALIKAEHAKWTDVIKRTGIKAE